jgi:hypothetical protein
MDDARKAKIIEDRVRQVATVMGFPQGKPIRREDLEGALAHLLTDVLQLADRAGAKIDITSAVKQAQEFFEQERTGGGPAACGGWLPQVSMMR